MSVVWRCIDTEMWRRKKMRPIIALFVSFCRDIDARSYFNYSHSHNRALVCSQINSIKSNWSMDLRKVSRLHIALPKRERVREEINGTTATTGTGHKLRQSWPTKSNCLRPISGDCFAELLHFGSLERLICLRTLLRFCHRFRLRHTTSSSRQRRRMVSDRSTA